MHTFNRVWNGKKSIQCTVFISMQLHLDYGLARGHLFFLTMILHAMKQRSLFQYISKHFASEILTSIYFILTTILWGLEIWTLQSKLDFCHNYFELPHDIPTRLSVSSSIRNYKSVDIVNYCLDCCIVAHCKNVFNLWKPCIIWNNP